MPWSGRCQVWRRTKRKAKNYKRLPIEEKESYRWVKGGSQAKAVLAEAAMVRSRTTAKATFTKNGLACRISAPTF